METESELNNEISRMITTIQNKYPELQKYIDEIPVTLSFKSGDHIPVENLKAYYDSLKSIFAKYDLTHH